MHLVLLPVRLPLLPLDLGPVREVEVSLVARPVRASVLLSPRLLQELGRGSCSFAADSPCPRRFLGGFSPLITARSAMWESLRGSAPVLDPPVFPDLRIEEQGRIVEPAHGRTALVTGPVVLALALLTARCQAVESVRGGTRLDRCPPASGHGVTGRGLRTAPGRGLQTAPGRVVFALALGETGHDPQIDTGLAETAFDVPGGGLLTATGHADSVRVPLLAGEVAVTVRCHVIPPCRSRDHERAVPPLLTTRGHWREDGEPDVSSRSVWRR